MAISPAAVATPQQLYQGQPGTSAATLYTAPANDTNVPSPAATTTITSLVLANTTGTAATVTLYLVPNGGTAGASNIIVPAVSIAANDVLILSGIGIQMPASSSLQGLQGTSGAITVTASGVVLS
jgi:hypothetical protein